MSKIVLIMLFWASLLTVQTAHSSNAQDKSVRVILVGDSTMATETGYGDAFCAHIIAPSTCQNLAKGGRSSWSYRAEGAWDKVIALIQHNPQQQPTYVLIQFGHNDQPGKPSRSTDLVHEFPNNIQHYVQDVKKHNAIAVLVTPLTRRDFRDGILQNSLKEWAQAITQVAQIEHVAVIDLNALSAEIVQNMGSEQADTLAMAPPPATPKIEGIEYRGFDHTHLGPKGAVLFANLVLQNLLLQHPTLIDNFKK